MKTLKDFFKNEMSFVNTLLGLCFAILAALPLMAVASNEHPTTEQTFSACFFSVLFLLLALFFMWLAIEDFNEKRQVR